MTILLTGLDRAALRAVRRTVLLRPIIPIWPILAWSALITWAITPAFTPSVSITIAPVARDKLAVSPPLTVAVLIPALLIALLPTIWALLPFSTWRWRVTSVEAGLRFLATNLAAGVRLVITVIRRVVVRLEA